MPKSIIIIGAGIGGLAAALRLAQCGYAVTVVDERPQVGGLACEYRARGFSWSPAPTMFYARSQLEALFRDLGRNPDDYLSWLPIDPQTRIFFPDGAVFNVYRDWTRMAAEIARLEPGDVAGYLRYLAYAARVHDLRRFGFGKKRSAFGTLFRSWLRAGPLRSASGAGGRYVRSAKLARALAHFASPGGGSAYTIPATYSEKAHAILNDGLWHPRGGLSALPQALAKMAIETNVEIRLGCPVRQMAIERGRAIGVILGEGELLRADAVISNIDPISTARYLLPEEAVSAPALRRLVQTPMTSSAFVLLLGIRGTFPQLAQHNIFFSDDGLAESEQIFRRDVLPEDPTITLSISCKTDKSSAPYDQENWLISVSVPPLSAKVNWATEGRDVRDRVLANLEERFGLDPHDRIRYEKQLTPADLARLSGAWRGALNGELPQGRRAALARPQIRSPHARLLYQVGAAVLPGGGLPQEILSAKAAVAMLREDLQ